MNQPKDQPTLSTEAFGDAIVSEKARHLKSARDLSAAASRDDGLLSTIDEKNVSFYGDRQTILARRNNRLGESNGEIQKACGMCAVRDLCVFQESPGLFHGQNNAASALNARLYYATAPERARFDKALGIMTGAGKAPQEDIPCELLLQGVRAWNAHKKAK